MRGKEAWENIGTVEQKVGKSSTDEVKEALKRMKNGKAVGRDDIPVVVWTFLGERAVEILKKRTVQHNHGM